MINFEKPTGPTPPSGTRIPPSELIRQKMAEMPKAAPAEMPTALPTKPKGRVNIFSIILLVIMLGVAGFSVFVFSSLNSQIKGLKSKVGVESPELKTQKEKLDLLERVIADLRKENEEKYKALEDKITGTTGFASRADLETITNILKTTDSDKDGLSDYEEVVTYKSNPNNKDTDGDGYFDKAEVDRGYNPAGPGKLEIKPEEKPSAEEKTIVKVSTSNYKFEPSLIEVGVGEDVRIELTSLDTTHTFTIDELGIDREVKAGGTEIIEFKPEKVGEYIFYSNKPTDKQNKMEGKLIVK